MFKKHRRPAPAGDISSIDVVPVCTNCWQHFDSAEAYAAHRTRPCRHLELRVAR